MLTIGITKRLPSIAGEDKSEVRATIPEQRSLGQHPTSSIRSNRRGCMTMTEETSIFASVLFIYVNNLHIPATKTGSPTPKIRSTMSSRRFWSIEAFLVITIRYSRRLMHKDEALRPTLIPVRNFVAMTQVSIMQLESQLIYLHISHHTGAVLFTLPAHTSELMRKMVHPTSVHPRRSKVPELRADK